MRYEQVAAYVYGTPWAILPEKLAVILDTLTLRAAGRVFSADEIRERVGAATPRPQAIAGPGIQVLRMYGTLAYHAGMMDESSGGCSTDAFTAAFKAAMADSQVGAIVLDVDSPGGTVDGIPELSDAIFQARGVKPVVAVANALMASAAYYAASSAQTLFVTPSGEVGSIGVWSAHQDASGYYQKEGVKTTLISAGRYKTTGNQYEPLSEEAKALMQARVDGYYDMFVKAVARNRGVSADAVRGGFGEGYVVGAQEAVKAGMADRVGTFDDAVAEAAKLAKRFAREHPAAGLAQARIEEEFRARMAGL